MKHHEHKSYGVSQTHVALKKSVELPVKRKKVSDFIREYRELACDLSRVTYPGLSSARASSPSLVVQRAIRRVASGEGVYKSGSFL
jgi:hypothetical protein